MAYACKLYYNTGFDLVNIPDSPSLFEQFDSRTFDSLNILQDQGLTSIRIHAQYSDVLEADYASIGSTYYYITEITMLNSTTCQLSLHCDFISSLGGVNALSVESGWISRCCVDSDELFEWTLPEDFVPNEIIQLESARDLISYQGNIDKILIQSTVNLPSLKNVDEEFKALTFTSGSKEDSLYIPYCPPVLYETTVGMVYGDSEENYIKKTTTPKSVLFLANDDNVKGLSVLRSISAESSILSQYVIPSVFIDAGNSSVSEFGSYLELIAKKFSHNITSLPYVYDASIQNKKCFCGEYNKYILTSTVSGNSVEVLPEEIYGGGYGYPIVNSSADLRPNGSPFAWFTYTRGIIDYNLQNSVYGLPWQDAPLLYTSKSGSNLDRFNFLASQYRGSVNQTASVISQMLGALGSATSAAGGVETFRQSGEGVNSLLGNAANSLSQGVSLGQNIFNYSLDRKLNSQNFMFSQAYAAPEIHFPRQEGLRDFVGNNFSVYRYRLSYNDLKRFDTYLTMYGYKVCIPFDTKYFHTRTNFNYLKVEEVSIATVSKSSLRMRLGAEQQLEGGIRIWHVKPSYTYFNNNPIFNTGS